MKHIPVSFVTLIAALTACAPQSGTVSNTENKPAASQNYSSFDQQKEAQAVLTRAVDAMGGPEALSRLASGKMTFSNRAARIGQAPTPDANGDLGTPSKTLAQRGNGLVAIDRFNGDNLGSRYMHGGLVDWIHFAGPNTVADVEPVLAGGIINQVQTSAHIVSSLLEASENARYAGTASEDGQVYDVVTFVNDLGQLQTAYFDKASGLLSSVQSLRAHPQWGDIALSRSYDDYRAINGVQVAHEVTTKQADIVASVVTLESFEAADIPDEIFEKPEDATQNDPFTAPSSAPRDLTVEKLGEDLYFIANAAQGYNVIFADHDDGVLIVETPQSIQSARDIIRTVNAELPGKTIKAAVPTHHHFDHSGGIYGFQEAGIPILTTPGNVKFATEIGTAPRNIGASKGAISSPKVESFETRMTQGSGDATVELINVGPNPHAEEIVIAYMPAIKSVFVADVFSKRADTLPPANANQLAFADRLEELDLDIETFIPVHGSNATAEEFWDSVKRSRDAAAE